MGERAPISITFYLDKDDADLLRSLWPAQKGCRFDRDLHEKLIEEGYLEVDKFNPGPDGECLDDVRITKKAEREIVRMKNAADVGFKARRASTSARREPGSSAIERLSRRPAPLTGELPSELASSPEPTANTYRAQLASDTETAT